MAPAPYIPWNIWRKVRDLALVVLAGLIALELGGWDIRTNVGLSSQSNPYLLPGYLEYSQWNPHGNRWHPFTGTSSPALLASLLRSSWAIKASSMASDILDPKGWSEKELGPDGKEWEDISWARGKTVLVIGDSVGRYQVKYFCEMAGEPLRELNWDHPFSPPEITGEEPKAEEHRVPETPEEIERYHQRQIQPSSTHGHASRGMDLDQGDDLTRDTPRLRKREDDTRHEGNGTGYHGHYCHVPGIDLMIVQVFNYGLDEKNFWTFREDYIPPYTVETRISSLALPYIRAIGRASSAPELTYVGSALWDTTRWMREDAANGKDIAEALSKERLNWYRTRIRQVLMHTRHVFPETKIKWSSHHYPLRAMFGWFFEAGDQKQRPNRPQQKLNRLSPLHEAAVSAINDLSDATSEEKSVLKNIDMNMWGRRMMGMEDHQKDDLHHKLLPGGYLWADMMLYDLREAVTKKWWKP
ncbi:uncharacterized protein I303_106350 [Kwoniella dejecticola CBS 10117]|uniref:Uncharacterized protein n=1 Tax=Kwoniella dejecticola CBS 10117 TaxID=1296121 RepID=A0A1A5ZUY9_9TREE|nr:uncharacterized protein I303_08393 [Kwoniella dejecticola CBS 10117]OBR81622.1 hypothetical protein I303_08393 [Kwoniella dejecticola CBS 10117]